MLIYLQDVNVIKQVQQVHTVTRSMDSVSVGETLEEEIVVDANMDTTTTHHAKV